MVRDRSERSIGQASIDPQSTSEGTMVRFGCILGAHGLRGALRLRPDNPESAALANIKKIAIDLRGQRSSFRVGKVDRIGHGILRIELDGVIEANAAEALKSGIVMIDRSDLPEIGPAEFYYFEAIGCAVFLT